LPHLNESLRQVQGMDGQEGWSVTTLAQVCDGVKIFKGPRLKTGSVLVEGPGGDNVEPYYTPSAILQERADSIKWVNMARANDKQRRAFDKVRVQYGDLLVTRSGSIGRVAHIGTRLAGAIVSDDAIRVRIADERVRAYVYAFLKSRVAVDQMMLNEYGSVQQHLEPEHLADLAVPVPDD